MDLKKLDKNFYKIDNWNAFRVLGKDADRFLDGQLTNDVSLLKIGQAQITSRVSRTGQLLFYSYLFKKSEVEFYVLSPVEFTKDLKTDLNKFIIMDDVELSEMTEHSFVTFDLKSIGTSEFKCMFLGIPAGIKFSSAEGNQSIEDFDKLAFVFGLPPVNEVQGLNRLINEYLLVDSAVSLSKGCFVGQETIKKVENNRGAGKKETILKINTNSMLKANELTIDETSYKVNKAILDNSELLIKILAKREHRIVSKSFEIKIGDKNISATILPSPLTTPKCAEVAQYFFEKGVGLFVDGKDLEAKSYLETARFFDSGNPEIVESLGALEGRMGNFEEAISLMDELEKIDPKSIMACTNRSLFYMKIGKIEEAEEEKAKATLRSFKGAGDLAGQNKTSEMLKRLDMYLQVIEIDQEDEMANQGAAQIYFDLEDYISSEKYVENLLSLNVENTKAMSIKAKILLRNGQNNEARELLEDLILLAGKKGDFLLANEMQGLMNSLDSQSSL